MDAKEVKENISWFSNIPYLFLISLRTVCLCLYSADANTDDDVIVRWSTGKGIIMSDEVEIPHFILSQIITKNTKGVYNTGAYINKNVVWDIVVNNVVKVVVAFSVDVALRHERRAVGLATYSLGI